MGLFDVFFNKSGDSINENSASWEKDFMAWWRINTDPVYDHMSIDSLSSLETLNLFDTGFTTLPSSIGCLKNLKVLNLAAKNLTTLPKESGLLEKLEELHLVGCNLTALPSSIGCLKNLKVLKLGGNKLTTFPKEIGLLEKLEKLTLYENKIIDLPKSISNLKNLKKISLWGNFIDYNNKLTGDQIEWLENLEKNGCEIENSSASEFRDIFDNNIKLYQIKAGALTHYMTIHEFEIIIQKSMDYGWSEGLFRDVNLVELIDGDGVYAERLSKIYTNSFLEKHNSENRLGNQDSKEFLDKYGINYLYHITHYKNLKSILENGLLAHNNDFTVESIDNKEVNNRRNKNEPIFNKNIHSYVPFYFNPKNSMLYARKELQEDIIILAFNRDLLMKEETVFSDGNAAADRTDFYNDISDLDELNWGCIDAPYWSEFEHGKTDRMAEILVQEKVNIKHLEKILCFDDETLSYIESIDDSLDVEINTKFYFE